MAKSATTTTIQVETNLIEQHLHKTIGNHEHATALVDSIVGVGKSSGKLGYIFMASLGVVPIQKFNIGDIVSCDEPIYDYWDQQPQNSQRPIGQCRIIGYKPYDVHAYEIEYTKFKSDATTYTATSWVEECELSEITITKSL